MTRRVLLIIAGIGLGIIAFMVSSHFSAKKNRTVKRVVVLAFDGMDPVLLEEGIGKNLLPAFAGLKKTGYFQPLATVMPPQSPVAWASFSTGVVPVKHGVYDFITRNPKDYSLSLTFESAKQIRQKPVWEYLTDNAIPMNILFLPDTYPPPKKISGSLISGMGTPDLLGTQGTASLITSKYYPKNNAGNMNIITIPNQDTVTLRINGPAYRALRGVEISSFPVEIKRIKDAITIHIQKSTVTVRKGEFSPWIPVSVPIDFFLTYNGMVKFFIKEISPDIELYLSPINFDPLKSPRPISYPGGYAKDLARRYGLFSTLGLPYDATAFNEGIFDEQAFLQHTEEISKERESVYFGEVGRFHSGLLVGYFGFTDTLSHMFWRQKSDTKSSYNTVIMDAYKRADAIVGKTLSLLRPDDVLFVISDHGFSSFDYEIDLNAWLAKNGYLVLKDGLTKELSLLESLDWSKTKAYALGYNGIYINQKGRERDGIVAKEDATALEEEVKKKLLSFKNPHTGNSVIKHVYTTAELGAVNDMNAPDILVGFYKGMRASFATAIGGVGEDIIKPRTSVWSGDHLFDASEVPGVLLSNVKIATGSPSITDITPTLLSLFGIPQSPVFDGKPLVK